MTIGNSVGGRIKIIRKAYGLTQGELAERLGYTKRQVQRWETDEVSPKTGVLRAFGIDLRISADWLVVGEGPMELPAIRD